MRFGMGMGLGLGAQSGGAKPAIFTFTSTGTGADTGTLSLFYPASEAGKIVKATGNVKLGAGGNLTEQVINGGATNTFTVTCLSDTGTLVLPNTYTRFSANTSDTAASNGWVTSANSPSLAFDITTFPIGLITFYCFGLNTVSGDLPADWKSMIYLYCAGQNTISGKLPADWKSMTSFYCAGYNAISGITEGAYAGDSNSPMRILRLNSSNNSGGLSTKDQEFLLINKATRTWSGTVFNLASAATAMESMADVAIPGRWFSAAGEPTDVAKALKKLAKEKNVAVSLKDLTMPDESSGDGAGFPVGFGDWWRL